MNRLELYGDSVLKGVIYSDEQKRYKLCKNNHYEELVKSGIEVRNNSHMGSTICEGLEILKCTLEVCDENTLVLFHFGGNDCNFNWKQVSENPEGEFLPNTPEDEFIKTYQEAIAYAKKMGAKVAVSSLVPLDSVKFMNCISKGLNFDHILHWLGDISLLSRWQEHYSRIVEQLAAETNCPLLDFRSEFLKSHHYQSAICSDGIHPNQLGHDMIVKNLCRFVWEQESRPTLREIRVEREQLSCRRNQPFTV